MKKVESGSFHRNKKNIESKNGNLLAPEFWKYVFVAGNTSTIYSYVISLSNGKRFFFQSHVMWFFKCESS